MPLLLTGPAGSGKTFRVLEAFRESLRRRDSGVRLLVPTATMAQHLQHLLAREGFVFRPGLIGTLSRFVNSPDADQPEVSSALLYLIVEGAARRVDRPEFARVVRMPGFCAALARTMAEFSSAGCDAERLPAALGRPGWTAPLGDAFVAVYREVERELRRRGLAMRSERLVDAAAQIERDGLGGVRTIWLDGFHALPDPELAVVRAMCGRAEVTLTLSDAPITAATRQRLRAMGFVEEMCGWQPAQPHVELCQAPGIEREADEIARRILEQSAAGRPFRQMGVIVRSPETYTALLRASFDRFGIPARFYFDAELSKHPTVRFLAGVVDAMLGEWDHALTLEAVRLASWLDSDEFDFAVRERIPGGGLATLQAMATGPSLELLRDFERLEAWRDAQLTPVEWASQLKQLRGLYRPGPRQPGNRDLAEMWRGQAAALDSFDAAMDETARALEARRWPLSEFWRAAKSVLRLVPLRAVDRRRDAVNVLSAYEARQWRLPVVFVCGLVEGQFPKFHMPDPFFPEAWRAQLQQAGIRVRTAADFEAEERFLFDRAVACASESVTLSYPRLDARGQPNLRSVFLDGIAAAALDCPPVRLRPVRTGAARTAPAIADGELLQAVAVRHAVFRPTALESYLQCPFQFFGRYTLALQGAPARPEDRLSFLVEGNIVHCVLAELARTGDAFEAVFEREFGRICREEGIRPSYRAEACRERLLADLRAVTADPRWAIGGDTRPEQKFQYALADGIEIRGRIDRIDVSGDAQARLIDYKYSRAQNAKKLENAANTLQPELYMLAAERSFGLAVAEMYYCGLRGGVTWVNLTDRTTPKRRGQAIAMVMRIVDEVRAGRVEPQPADIDKCRFCDFRDACRFDAAGAELAEGA